MMKRLFNTYFSLGLTVLLIFLVSACASQKISTKKVGNSEIVDVQKGGEVIYRLVYTEENGKKVKGEYWEPIDPKSKKDKKPETNILAGTAIAKKMETLLAGKKVIDESDIKLNVEKDGFVLKFVKMVKYNKSGLPEKVINRGYTAIPFLGIFNIKTDLNYTYNAAGKVIKITETNINIDSLLLNFGIGNITLINRDAKNRPVKVVKTIGSIPPAVEVTEFSYYGNTDDVEKTVYKKCGIDFKNLSIVPSETITTNYGQGVPWEGNKKYSFSLGTNVVGFKVYDDIAKKDKLDGSNFSKMNYMDKAMFTKNIYDMLKNEMKGPKWRIGDLPDVPEPFLLYGDMTWW